MMEVVIIKRLKTTLFVQLELDALRFVQKYEDQRENSTEP